MGTGMSFSPRTLRRRLTRPQRRALLALAKNPRQSHAQIAKSLGQSPQGFSRLLRRANQRLTNLGLVPVGVPLAA